MALDLSSFDKAFASLREAWAEYQKDETNKFVRDAVVQRFEYTYELSHKMLKRFLAETEFNSQEIKEMAFSDIIRTANEKNLLLNDLERWGEYRRMRNITSHTYDESRADEIVSIVPGFIAEIDYFLNKLRGRAANPGDKADAGDSNESND
jgi:nucleotidyltransferase substrate binding protein (TIGR01987 family)